MSVERALQELWARLHTLRETLVALRLTAVEDAPGPATAFSDRFGEEVEDLEATLAEAFNAVAAVLEASDDVERVRAALDSAHRAIGVARDRYWVSVGGRVPQTELDRLRRRGTPWRKWVDTLRRGAAETPRQLADADAAVRMGWRELVERAAAAPVQVQTTAIGQQVTFPATEGARAPLG
jgi:hypothetical protein